MTTRKIVVTILILLIAFGLLCASIYFIEQEQKQEVDNSIKEIAVPGDYIQYEYTELKGTAKVIAEVEVLDDLSIENSRIISAETGEVIGFYSPRKVKALNCFKGGDQIPTDLILEIIDDAAMKDNLYLHQHGYEG